VDSPILERSHLKLRPLKLTMPIPQWRTSPTLGGAFLCKYRSTKKNDCSEGRGGYV
jgi:hypothetical protein